MLTRSNCSGVGSPLHLQVHLPCHAKTLNLGGVASVPADSHLPSPKYDVPAGQIPMLIRVVALNCRVYTLYHVLPVSNARVLLTLATGTTIYCMYSTALQGAGPKALVTPALRSRRTLFEGAVASVAWHILT